MNDSTFYPLCASENLQIEETGTEVIVFDTKKEKFHFLNATAYNILKACNGSNSIRDIAIMLSGTFKAQSLDSIINDVNETLGMFQTQGLLLLVADDLALPQAASDPTSDSSLIAVHVTGSSMFPALLSGDRVLVKKSAFADLNVGDIIVWSDDSLNHVAHRIVSMDGSATTPVITTKGDLQLGPDPAVESDRVIGKLVAVLRGGEVKWISQLDGRFKTNSSDNRPPPAPQKPSYKKMQVLDLRDISADSIRNIGSVEQIGLVLLAPENAHAWSDVQEKDVKRVLTAPRDYRVFTGQPELFPEMIEFLEAPLRLIVSGQLFLTSFDSQQIISAFKELILVGQTYVSSEDAKTALESVTNIVSGEISVAPTDHSRWIGHSILGPEYLSYSPNRPLVVIGDLAVSERLGGIPDNLPLFGNSLGRKHSTKARAVVT